MGDSPSHSRKRRIVMQVCTDLIEVYPADQPKAELVDWGVLVASIWANNRRPLQHSPKVDAVVRAAIELKEMVANREQ